MVKLQQQCERERTAEAVKLLQVQQECERERESNRAGEAAEITARGRTHEDPSP